MDWISIAGIISICMNYCVYTPLTILLYGQFRKYENEKMMQYREPLVLYVMFAFVLIEFLIEPWWPLLTYDIYILYIHNTTAIDVIYKLIYTEGYGV